MTLASNAGGKDQENPSAHEDVSFGLRKEDLRNWLWFISHWIILDYMPTLKHSITKENEIIVTDLGENKIIKHWKGKTQFSLPHVCFFPISVLSYSHKTLYLWHFWSPDVEVSPHTKLLPKQLNSVLGVLCPKLLQAYSIICNPMDCNHQAPLSMGFSRQQYWSGLPCPAPGDLSYSGIRLASPALAGRFFTTRTATWVSHNLT